MTIRARFVWLVALAAIAPLVIYGAISIASLRTGTRESVRVSHSQIVVEAEKQISQYLEHNVKMLRGLVAVLTQTVLTANERERLMTSFVLDFPEFRSLTAFDGAGVPTATTNLVHRPSIAPLSGALDASGLRLSRVDADDDLLPRASITLALGDDPRVSGWLNGELSLEELWRTVDQVRVGREGYALLVDDAGRLIAHGDPNAKGRVALGESLSEHPIVAALREPGAAPVIVDEYASRDREMLSVGTTVPLTGWTLLIEQPTSDAYALASRLVRQLAFAIATALVLALGWSLWSARAVIKPIDTLADGTRRLAAGKLDTRVDVSGDVEFQRLGAAFNEMADRLAELRATAVKQERQALLGRMAAGLAHDLAHPIQNISNNCKLMVRMHDDEEYRGTFHHVIDREVGAMRRMLDDLKNLARPLPPDRFVLDLNRSLRDLADAVTAQVQEAGLSLELALSHDPLWMSGDLLALGRVYRNLVVNAIQASNPGGCIRISSAQQRGKVTVTVSDTGCGIEPARLSSVFDDFTTTKRRGLGLGLAISKRIVEQLDGTIRVESEVGKGTSFTLEFPFAQPEPKATAS
jgi:two-component system NtrC family sensor kinase